MKSKVCPIILLFLSPYTAIAADPVEKEVKKPVQHFEVKAPESTDAAVALLDSKLQELAGIIEGDDLDVATLEKIHRLSYDLEAAVERLQQAHSTEDLSALAERIEQLHLSSERHQAAGTVSAFEQIAKSWTDLAPKIRRSE